MFVMYHSHFPLAHFVVGIIYFDKTAQVAVKGDLREAGDGAARQKEVMEMQKCQ